MLYQPPQRLAGPRVTLRPLTADDAAHHGDLFARPEVVRHLYDEPLEGDRLLAHLERRFWRARDEDEFSNWAVESRGRFLGEVGLCCRSREFATFEVGYVFLPSAAGHGYATEAVSLLIDDVVSAGAHRLVGRLDARNAASAAVLRRLGFRHEAHFVANEFIKGEWCDEDVYALLASEWTTPAR